MTVEEVIKKFNLKNVERVYFDKYLHYGGREDANHISTEVCEITIGIDKNNISADIILNTNFY